MIFKEEIEGITISPATSPEIDEIIEKVFNESVNPRYYYKSNFKNSPTYQDLKKKDDVLKSSIALRVLDYMKSLNDLYEKEKEKEETKFRSKAFNLYYKKVMVFNNILEDMLRSKIIFTENSLLSLFDKLQSITIISNSLPYNYAFKQIKYLLTKEPDSKGIIEFLKRVKEKPRTIRMWKEKDRDKLIVLVTELLQLSSSDEGDSIIKILWSEEDSMGKNINQHTESLDPLLQEALYKIYTYCKKASGGKPSAKFKDESKTILDSVNQEDILESVNFILAEYANFTVIKETRTYTHRDRTHTYDSYKNISPVNADMLKAFIWVIIPLLNSDLINVLAKIAEKAYKKIPGKGPANAAVGNAAFYALASSNSLEAVNHLSRLKLKLKQSSVLKLIDNYIEEIAKESGLGKREMEDMAVPDYGLKEGRLESTIGEYNVEIIVRRVGSIDTVYKNPEGKIVKTLPAKVKSKNKEEVKRISDLSKEIQKSLTANRDRLDRSYIYKREWKYEDFLKYFHNHGLMCKFSNNLIWTFSLNSSILNLFFHEGKWIDYRKKEHIPEVSSIIEIWHPVGKDLEEVLAWREFILENEISQPFKQAFRELYIITDAELNTRTYSNRMAAHIIKQHQFNTLAKGRGWSYSLMGAYDDGRDSEIAEIVIPEHNLKSHFWINELYIEDEFNDAGIWNFVGTDQVRFLDNTGSVLDLSTIPAIVFSEIMRDVDLFVGVGSVGNDPEWTDRGNIANQHRNYWQSYSFGDLNETAKIRKQVLEKILPKLKIAKVSEIKDKFLYVKGKIRTYKIHIGSSNILMEPNDEYLCIVPDRGKAKTENFFLPFEGDAGLSAVLSKAFLLSNDDKITDATITRQINKSN